ncbi:MAG: hypothetical protein ABI353_03140, partial [Isosphaeraceae bacterium]
MHRRQFLQGVGALAAVPFAMSPGRALAAAASLPEAHFPDRFHLFVWRNWELANVDRLAEVAGCRPEDVLAVGASMGLPTKPTLTADQLRRIYITAIRQNWYLLPKDQLIRLLGWTDETFQFTLKEDDFLDVKLGPTPNCPPLVYEVPSAEAKQRSAEIKALVEAQMGSDLNTDGEPPFAFVSSLSSTRFTPRRDPAARPKADQVDLSGWSVQGGDSVDPRVVARLVEYLKTAMGAAPDPGAQKVIRLRLDPEIDKDGERFQVKVEADRVEVAAHHPGSLLQGIYWLRDQMEEHGGPFLTTGVVERVAAFRPRYLYSYFALYGDPLMETDIDPFPSGLLEKLAKSGASGVWLQGVLNNLAPSDAFPEFGKGAPQRLAALNRLVERASQYGMKVYLYLNEPRSMPAEFFKGREELKGAEKRGYFAMCTAQPAVRDWISDSLAHVFKQVPGLGGVFSITMSENLTNCYSGSNPSTCPRCSKRENWGTGVEEALLAIHAGVRRSSQDAEVIVYDWAWREDQANYLIPRMPKDSKLLCVSEWSAPVERGGVKTKVGEYSISVVGPGPRAIDHWALAKKSGVAAMAKVQLNNTWEISAVPYVPVANLVAQHCVNLAKVGVSGLMESWTLGGYPSPNLEIAKEVCFAPEDGVDAVLERVARRRYGAKAAPLVLKAWQGFSNAYSEYPYGISVYIIPTQHGPANLLRGHPSGAPPGMILFPQDAYKSWSGAYPPPVVRDQFTKMADLWEQALPLFQEAVKLVPETRKADAEEDLAIAETCLIHFRSVAHQIAFYLLRDGGKGAADRPLMRDLVIKEMELAKRMYRLAKRHAVLAFEAS